MRKTYLPLGWRLKGLLRPFKRKIDGLQLRAVGMQWRGVGGVADGEQLAERTRTLQGYAELP